MLKKLLFPILFFTLVTQLAVAQTGSITGKVTNAQGEPVPTANILLVEISRGTASNIDGVYTINNVDAGTYTLRVTFVGYKEYKAQVTINAGDELVKNVTLQSGAVNLDELVVTALGVKRSERSLGYDVEEVEGDVITQTAEAGVVSALTGATAGVIISGSSGDPGSPSNIIIRGNSSITGSNQPLFVVDGVPISSGGGGGSLFTGVSPSRAIDIDPNIVKSVTVLKGASATALYGSRAANGVILITTKGGGLANKPSLRVSVNSSVGYSDAILDGFQNQYLMGDHGKYTNGLPINRGGYVEPGYQKWFPGSGDPQPNPQTFFSWGPRIGEVSQAVLDALGVNKIPTYNPREAFYDTGVKIDNNVSISGGTATSSYYFSISKLDQKGIVPGSELDRTSFFAQFDQELSDKLDLNVLANYVDVGNTRFPTGNTHRSYTQNLNNTAISFDITDYEWPDGTQRYQTGTGNNPLWLVKNSRYLSDVTHFIGSFSLGYELNSWLSLSERLGVDTFNSLLEQQWNKGVVERPNGQVVNNSQQRTEITSDFTLNFDRTINEDLSFYGLVGNTINARSGTSLGFTGNELSVPDFFDPSNVSSVSASYNNFQHRIVSLYGSVTFDYDAYLYLTLTGRNDWSSTLPKGNNSYFYPSASVGFIFSNFISENSILSFGKLRLAYAQIGNDAGPYSIYANLTQAGPGDAFRGFINYPYNGVNGYKEGNTLGNLNLKPEKTSEIEAGLELKFFENRLHTEITYYNRLTEDQIFPISIAPSSGYTSSLINAGAIRNKGWEIGLGGSPIQTESFLWDIQINFTRNRTVVERLAPGVTSITLAGYTAPNIRVLPRPDGYGVIWAQKFEHDANGNILVDDNGYPVYEGSVGDVGNVTPDFTANLRSTFSYKGIGLMVLFDTRQGGEILNFNYWDMALNGTAEVTAARGTQMADPSKPGYIKPFVYPGVNVNTGEANTVAILRDQDYYLKYWWPVYENYVEDASYVKLRQVTLSYNLPVSLLEKLPLTGVKLAVTGRNLFTWSDFSMGDPTGNILGVGNAQGFYHEVTPTTRSVSFSIGLTF